MMRKNIYHIKGDRLYSQNLASSIFAKTKLKINFTKKTLNHNQQGKSKKLKSFLNNKPWQQQYLIIDNQNYYLNFVTLPTYVTTNIAKEQLQVQHAAQHKIDPSNIVIDYCYREDQKSALLFAVNKQMLSQQQKQLQSMGYTASHILPQDLCWLALCKICHIDTAFFLIHYESHTSLMVAVNGAYQEQINLPKFNAIAYSTQLKLNLTLLKKKYSNIPIQTVFYIPVENIDTDIKTRLMEQEFASDKLFNIYDILKQKYQLDFKLCPISASLLLGLEYQKNKPNTYLAIKNKTAFWQKTAYTAGLGLWLLLAAKTCMLGISITNVYAGIEPAQQTVTALKANNHKNDQKLSALKTTMDKRAIIGVLTPEALQETISFTQTLMPLSQQKFSDLWLNDIAINQEKNEMSIKGQALSKTELFSFYQYLIQSPEFNGLTIKETKNTNSQQQYLDRNNQAKSAFNFTLERNENAKK
jgi:hypothetical protein